MDGVITLRGLEAAARSYLAQDEDAPELLIARNVPLVHWLEHGLDNRLFNVYWSCRFEGDAADPTTLASVYIVRAIGGPHQRGVGAISFLRTPLERNHLISTLGFDLVLPGQTRRPDTVFFQQFRDSRNSEPCVVVELEHRNRSFRRLLEWLLGYFALIPSLRTAVGIKMFKGPDDNPRQFGAVAVQLNRANGHAPHLAYVASIGTGPLTPRAMSDIYQVIRHEDADAMPHFEDGVAHEVALGHKSWQLDAMDCPVLKIKVADLLFLDDNDLLADAPPTTERLEMDLYKVIYQRRGAWDLAREIGSVLGQGAACSE
ncbi:hypothetical protein SPRG_22083 [Saprolegnia parasitica CBS 223.65]|uniref:Uncharacterized protein n=1 Tax=Saprolegnia parasitica (strain CBS 223.65) TaxID=695850 RepID=A0A067D6L0_SAPPC|nr:hypothetical protein SPRG_22083 [Saprolegnia parasitica CBS 223.65]KDO34316.1 hypothetical protein SPRG_22083 [Saprolegnia parasitica CBS 223.65]|eukprot:XP_012195347.1 hypothetical protein SPRG_22083 [Saprolegnia parasitica CBS 223.65]